MASHDNNWYEERRYLRFWKSYSAVMNWSRRHRTIYWKARAKAEEYENWALKYYINAHKGSNQCFKITNQKDCSPIMKCESESSEVVMEITDEMLAFLEKSHRHREKLKTERASLASTNKRTFEFNEHVDPPVKPGLQRSVEINALYGSDGAKIQAMETAMQLSFNRNCEGNQSSYWPYLPLRL